MTDILHHSGTNPDERKKIETEQEACGTVMLLVNTMLKAKKRILRKH